MKESEEQKSQEQETPAYNSNMSGDDIMGRSDFYVNPLAAMFTQNMVTPPAAFTGAPLYNPFFMDEWKNAKEKEDDLRK